MAKLLKASDLTEDQKRKIELYAHMKTVAKLQQNVVQDLLNNKNESVIYRKYPKERIVSFLEAPQRNEREIRELSNFLYIISSHYRRLVDYFSNIMKYNYVVIPTFYNDQKITDINIDDYRICYQNMIRECDKYNLKQESKKMIKTAIREGIFYGLYYETDDSFYIKPINPHYAKVSHIEDGTFVFSFDLAYFSGKENLLANYDKEFENAYYKYKGKNGKQGNRSLKWYRPSNGICIKNDDTDPVYSFPYFTGLLMDLYDIDDYKMIQKAKSENDNFKALSLKMETDDDGIPKMDYDLAMKYYSQIAANVADGVGVLLSPFNIDDFSFAASSTAERDKVTDTIDKYWYGAGISPLMMGSSKATSSSSLLLSTKSDEAISYSLMEQIARFFNKKIKNMNFPFGFKIEFTDQSIFNEKESVEKYSKAAQYGVSGSKIQYATALGFSPSDLIGMAFLEDHILKLGTDMFNIPLISSHTTTSEEVGRPTNDDNNKSLTDSGEQTKETDQNDNK